MNNIQQKKDFQGALAETKAKKVIFFFIYQENSVHIFPPKRLQLLNKPIPKLDPWTGSNTIKQLHNNNVKEGSSLDSKENLEYPATENLKNFYSGFIEDIENNQVEKNEKSELEINEEEGNHFLDGFSIFPFKRSHKMVKLSNNSSANCR